jgi:UDP-xylose:glucoside alpha-1,3-xylosyltransferase
MLMNLTRMRQVNMISKIINIFDEFHMNITWGDQCLLNIYFNYYPGKRYFIKNKKIIFLDLF